MRKGVVAALFLLVCSLAGAQQLLNNDAVLKLVKAGLSDDLIIATIDASPGAYDTSADALITLENAGASDKVLSAVIRKASGSSSALIAESPAGTQPSPTPNGNEVLSPTASTSSSGGGSAEPGTATGSGPISPGARVVIAPMGRFETYFAAAVREKGVPITLTLDKSTAQYFVVSTNTEWEGFVYGAGGTANWNRAGGSAAYGEAASSTPGLEASIMLINAKTKDVVWAYEVHKNSHGGLLFGTLAARGQQSVAEACAKHMKEYIERGK